MPLEASLERVRNFTLKRHGLVERAPRDRAIDAVDWILGLNAQGALNYQISLWNRVADLEHEFIESALYVEHSLVRSWYMRDTIHIVPSKRHPVFRAALRSSLMEDWNRWTVRTGAKETPSSWEAHYQGILSAFEEGPLSVNQLLEALGWRGRDSKTVLFRVIREMSLQGLLCNGAPSGPWYHSTEHTYARVDRWLGAPSLEAPPEAEAKRWLVRRYLMAYGPASIQDFAYWTGMKMREARPVFEALSDELEEVVVPGQRRSLYLMDEDVAGLFDEDEMPAHVRLLPQFDALIMGHRDKSRFMTARLRERVFLPRADVEATILVDGSVGGVWRLRKDRGFWRLELEPYVELDEEHEAFLLLEIDDLRRFTGFEIRPDWIKGRD